MNIDIDIKFVVKDFNPKIKVMINDTQLYKGVAQEHLRFSTTARWGLKQFNNKLIIERYGKDYKLHQTYSQDQAVIIKEIRLNGVSFPFITTHGVFTTDRGERLKTDYLGHNGSYVFIFGYPVETWVANHMYNNM